MVYAQLNNIKNDMASIASSGGGSFTNMNSSGTSSNRPTTQNYSINSSSNNETSRPLYDSDDPRSMLKTLIRYVMRTFYEIPKSFVIEYIFHYGRTKQQDLAERLGLDSKSIRAYIQEFKRDKFIIEGHRLEPNESKTGRRSQDEYYYDIDRTTFIDVVRYRLVQMRAYVENFERQQTYRHLNYKCEHCLKEYTELDIGKLFDNDKKALICLICGEAVHEDNENKEESNNGNRQVVNMRLFNEQTKKLFEILEDIERITREHQRDSSDQESLQSNGNSSANSSNRANNSANHRSQTANVFDRASHINDHIEIIIETDEDEYSHVDIDETSNTDSTISSSRGPGKPGKKSSKPVQSAADAASQPVSNKMKSATKKAPYEPKPLPHWFIRSTIHEEQEDTHHQNHSSSQPIHHSSTFSRQICNQKIVRSTSIQDIKQMLLVYESQKKKTFPSTTMEDSLSPPTPMQMTRTTNSQSSSSMPQFNSNNPSNGMDEDDAANSLFNLINEESVHHMDIDKND